MFKVIVLKVVNHIYFKHQSPQVKHKTFFLLKNPISSGSNVLILFVFHSIGQIPSKIGKPLILLQDIPLHE